MFSKWWLIGGSVFVVVLGVGLYFFLFPSSLDFSFSTSSFFKGLLPGFVSQQTCTPITATVTNTTSLGFIASLTPASHWLVLSNTSAITGGNMSVTFSGFTLGTVNVSINNNIVGSISSGSSSPALFLGSNYTFFSMNTNVTYTPILATTVTVVQTNITYTYNSCVNDTEFPSFFNLTSNNASQVSSGFASLFSNILSTNGSVWAQINNINYTGIKQWSNSSLAYNQKGFSNGSISGAVTINSSFARVGNGGAYILGNESNNNIIKTNITSDGSTPGWNLNTFNSTICTWFNLMGNVTNSPVSFSTYLTTSNASTRPSVNFRSQRNGTSTGATSLDVTLVNITNGASLILSDNTTYPANTWKHVCLTLDRNSSQASLYVNGSLVTNGSIPSGILANRSNLTFLKSDGSSLPVLIIPFNGSIDEVMLFNRSLSSSDISSMYSNQSVGLRAYDKDPSLFAYFSFDTGYYASSNSLLNGSYLYSWCSYSNSTGDNQNCSSSYYTVNTTPTSDSYISYNLNGVSQLSSNLSVSYPSCVNVTLVYNGTSATIKINGTTVSNSACTVLGSATYFVNVSVVSNSTVPTNESWSYVTVNQNTSRSSLVELLNDNSGNVTYVFSPSNGLNVSFNKTNYTQVSFKVNETGQVLIQNLNNTIGGGNSTIFMNESGNNNYSDRYYYLYAFVNPGVASVRTLLGGTRNNRTVSNSTTNFNFSVDNISTNGQLTLVVKNSTSIILQNTGSSFISNISSLQSFADQLLLVNGSSLSTQNWSIAVEWFYLNVSKSQTSSLGISASCRYRKLGFYNLSLLTWAREVNCI